MEIIRNDDTRIAKLGDEVNPIEELKSRIGKPKVTLIEDNGLFSFKKDGHATMCPFIAPLVTEQPASIMTNNQPSLNIQHIPCKSTCPMFKLLISDKGNVGIQTTCGCMPVNYVVTSVEQIKK
jgi:hypothetical protein